ncbi:MAG: hypothetical protein CFE45_26850, partial [Burkholderiales bacterium PBB5]
MSKMSAEAHVYAVNLVPSFDALVTVEANLGNQRRFEFRHVLVNDTADLES